MKNRLPIGILALLSLAGCAAGGASDAASYQSDRAKTGSTQAMAKAEAAPAEAKAASMESVIQNRMIIRTADLTLRVDNVESAEKQVQRIVYGFGGYVGTASSTDLDSDHPTLSFSMRVPVRSFDEAMSKIEALGTRVSKTINSEDVTEKVVDMDARLKSMLAQEESFRGMLRQTRSMNDVIALQRQLMELRSNIESMAAQRKSLASAASLSTISLTLTQSAVANPAPKDPNWLAQTWGEATTQMGGFLRGFAGMVIWLLVFSPFWAPALWLLFKAFRSVVPKKQHA